MKIIIASILALSCSASTVLDQRDLDFKISEEMRFIKSNPTKAKKRFSIALDKLGSQKSLNSIRSATAKEINSKSKVKEGIARKFMKMVKHREGPKGAAKDFETCKSPWALKYSR
jgi:hypothetical protein